MKSVHDIHTLADAYADQGRWFEAVEAYKTALGLDPDSADLHNDLGIAYEEIGNTELAEQAYHNAIALRPNHSNAYFNLGSLYQESDRLTEATFAFENCLQFTNDPDERSAATRELERIRERTVRKSFDERFDVDKGLESNKEFNERWEERLKSLAGGGDLGCLLMPLVFLLYIFFSLFPSLETKFAMVPQKIEKRWGEWGWINVILLVAATFWLVTVVFSGFRPRTLMGALIVSILCVEVFVLYKVSPGCIFIAAIMVLPFVVVFASEFAEGYLLAEELTYHPGDPLCIGSAVANILLGIFLAPLILIRQLRTKSDEQEASHHEGAD